MPETEKGKEMRTTFSASLFSKHPTSNPRYRPGDIVKTLKDATGTTDKSSQQAPWVIPIGSHGTISEIASFKPREEYPPRWIYRVRFPGAGETRYWIKGSALRLVERNPKIKRAKKKPVALRGIR